MPFVQERLARGERLIDVFLHLELLDVHVEHFLFCLREHAARGGNVVIKWPELTL